MQHILVDVQCRQHTRNKHNCHLKIHEYSQRGSNTDATIKLLIIILNVNLEQGQKLTWI